MAHLFADVIGHFIKTACPPPLMSLWLKWKYNYCCLTINQGWIWNKYLIFLGSLPVDLQCILPNIGIGVSHESNPTAIEWKNWNELWHQALSISNWLILIYINHNAVRVQLTSKQHTWNNTPTKYDKLLMERKASQHANSVL